MSTTGITTWAVDLAEVGPIYPFQGYETLMAIVAVVAWLAWHVWCVRWEQNYNREKVALYGNHEKLVRAVETY